MVSTTLFSSLPILLMLLITQPSITAEGANPLIATACRRAENPAFCMNVLGSDPRTGTVDMKGLEKIAVELASYNATGTSVKIHSLYLGAKDPSLRARFRKCYDLYTDGVNNLKLALQFLNAGEYSDVNTAAAGAYDAAADCEDAFKTPPAIPSPLTIDNRNMRFLCDIVAAIANILSH